MQAETVVGAVVMALAVGFFGWCRWVLDPKHPERLERLRRSWL